MDVGIISHLMSNWTSPILVVPKKHDKNVSNTTDSKQFNLRLCIEYHKLNNRILTARQIMADGRLGKVVDKGKLKFHSLPFGINLGPSVFSYVLGKVLASCHNFALNYLDDVINSPGLGKTILDT